MIPMCFSYFMRACPPSGFSSHGKRLPILRSPEKNTVSSGRNKVQRLTGRRRAELLSATESNIEQWHCSTACQALSNLPIFLELVLAAARNRNLCDFLQSSRPELVTSDKIRGLPPGFGQGKGGSIFILAQILLIIPGERQKRLRQYPGLTIIR